MLLITSASTQGWTLDLVAVGQISTTYIICLYLFLSLQEPILAFVDRSIDREKNKL